jgi:hypothetical protein
MSSAPTKAAATLDPAGEGRFWSGVGEAGRFFMGQSDVHRALEKLARILEDDDIPYAIIGAMALNEFGYRRVTAHVDVLLTADGLARFEAAALGRGYVEKFAGSRGLKDTEHGVDIDVVLAGGYPGDGQPKPVAFPDPAVTAQKGARVSLLPLPKLIELKLASGQTAAHRLKDLADVQELIRVAALPEQLADELDPYVRETFRRLWSAVQDLPPE